MPSTLYRDVGYSLVHLIEDIKAGKIGLPDIQRPFVWTAAKARDLFDSMYRGYPIGTLMLWETGADAGTRQIGLDESYRVPQLLIVDGQQRLTSLFAVLTGRPVLTKTYEERRIRIAFRPEDEVFEVTDAAIERDPEFIPDITALWSDGYRITARKFLQRLTEARSVELSEEQRDILEQRIDRVRDLPEFRFHVVELGASSNEEQVAEIFVRTNSQGVQLNQADFILTLMSVHWDKGRAELEGFSRAAVDPRLSGPSPKNPFLEPSPDQLLRVAVAVAFRRARLQHVYNILRGKDLESGRVSPERQQAQFQILEAAQERVLDLTNWHEFLKCLTAAGFRSRRMITSANALLFSYALWLIGRREFGLELSVLRPVIGRWFFMAHTMGRYTTSPESQFESDLGRISDLPRGDGSAFIAELDRIVAANFTGDYWDISLPNRLDTSSPRSPVLFAYLAALTLLDADVLFSDVRVRDLLDPATTAPRAMERHHLFPRKYLETLGISATRQVNAIANMAFLDWAENAKISDVGPRHYWPVMTEHTDPAKLKRQTYWHALPIGWEQLDYTTFLDRRQTLIARVIRDGFATLWGEQRSDHAATAEDLIQAGESQTIEFKATARLRGGEHDAAAQAVIVKTVCGFLNAEGGSLLIGVDDSGAVVGLEHDYRSLPGKPNADGFELFLRQLLDAYLSSPTAGTVRVRFPSVNGREICLVSVAASGKPVFARSPKGSGAARGTEFWVRIGNATKQLHGDDMVEYQNTHWG